MAIKSILAKPIAQTFMIYSKKSIEWTEYVDLSISQNYIYYQFLLFRKIRF